MVLLQISVTETNLALFEIEDALHAMDEYIVKTRRVLDKAYNVIGKMQQAEDCDKSVLYRLQTNYCYLQRQRDNLISMRVKYEAKRRFLYNMSSQGK